MAFNKIKETIAAFEPEPSDLNRSVHISKKTSELQRLQSGKKEKVHKAISVGVFIFVILPCIYLFTKLFRALFPELENTISAVIISSILAYSYSYFHDQLFLKIPFYKMNPYIGTKIEETIKALRREKPREKTLEMFDQ